MGKVRDVWRDVVSTLREHRFSAPTLEARLIMAEALSTASSRIYLYWDQEMDHGKKEKIERMLEKRLQGIPLQYVLGEWEFFSLTFKTQPGVFIPRLDTEAWLEEALIRMKMKYCEGVHTICDLCCGSGVIGITTAYWLPNITVYGFDISHESVQLSRENASRLRVQDRVIFFRSDLFAIMPTQPGLQFDCILSNPPYVRDDEWQSLSSEITQYEPKNALVAGMDGLDIIRRIFREGPAYLKPGGFLYIEHDPDQVDSIRDLLSGHTHLTYDHTIPDFQQKSRASVIYKKE
ncbi:MAG: peptide chain release factor N(5)-glutamine methyltransferase [Atribacterota bacterium]